MRRRPLTGMEVGAILGVVALLVTCCLGLGALDLLRDPVPVQPWRPAPTASY